MSGDDREPGHGRPTDLDMAFYDAMPRPDLPPCPPWCSAGPHDPDEMLVEHTGAGTFHHELEVGTVFIRQLVEVGFDGSVQNIDPAVIALDDGVEELSAAQARALAADLLAAADELARLDETTPRR